MGNNIRKERAKVARSGATFRNVLGDEASEADLAAMLPGHNRKQFGTERLRAGRPDRS